MASDAGRVRLFVDDDLIPGARLALDDRQAHYLGSVMRMKEGACVRVFNGHDGEWRALITELNRRGGELVADGCLRPQIKEPGPWLLFAPLKKTSTDYVIEKATELGVKAVCPVLTRRTVTTRVNLDRLYANVVEAAEQCERLTLPEIRAPKTLEQALADWPEGWRLFYMDETGTGAPVADVFKDTPEENVGILIGPEGGFDESELDALAALPFSTPVSLGPRILRAETAAASALACWQALRGDWSEPPKQRRRT